LHAGFTALKSMGKNNFPKIVMSLIQRIKYILWNQELSLRSDVKYYILHLSNAKITKQMTVASDIPEIVREYVYCINALECSGVLRFFRKIRKITPDIKQVRLSGLYLCISHRLLIREMR